jgi:cell wall-associated NlpC family hydrolase
MTTDEARLAVEAEARTWLGTPYHHRAAVRGVGVDCARILIEVYSSVGLIEWYDPGRYTRDWYMHRSEEIYLANLEGRAHLARGDSILDEWIADGYKPLKGDIVVWRVGRTFSHGAIVTEWPYVIHASAPSRVVEEVSVLNTPVHKRKLITRHYSFWDLGS